MLVMFFAAYPGAAVPHVMTSVCDSSATGKLPNHFKDASVPASTIG
jgi:hypothetical protein